MKVVAFAATCSQLMLMKFLSQRFSLVALHANVLSLDLSHRDPKNLVCGTYPDVRALTLTAGDLAVSVNTLTQIIQQQDLTNSNAVVLIFNPIFVAFLAT